MIMRSHGQVPSIISGQNKPMCKQQRITHGLAEVDVLIQDCSGHLFLGKFPSVTTGPTGRYHLTRDCL